jgi:hypothetical protein
MIKKAMITLGYSILLTVLSIVFLLITKPLFLDYIVSFIMKARGTDNYEGEEKGMETWNIIVGMIIPSVFLLVLLLMIFLRKRKKFQA